MDIRVLDYGRSFISGKGARNEARFWVESTTTIADQQSGREEIWYQCGSCKSEDTFARRNLFYSDNYDFLPVFGPQHGLIFRRKAYAHAGYREVRPIEEMFGGPVYRLQVAQGLRRLHSNQEVREATHSGAPLVGRTVIKNEELGVQAVMEYPIKTMNTHTEKNLFQVDTGPLLLPDLSARPERWADALSLAYVAFNVPDFADFVIEVETPISGSGGAVAQVHHYSELITLDAENQLFVHSI